MPLCAKCQTNEATSQTWCKACRAKYQREYEDTKEDKAFRRGFQAGVEAQRTDYVDRWLWFPGDALVSCADVAKNLNEAPRPSYTPKVIEMVSDPAAAKT